MRHMAQISDVVDTLMSRAVVGHDAGPVEGEDDGQVLEADVVIDLVVGPLEEGRIDGADRRRPPTARPAANVTACCSAIPTS